MTDTDPMVFGRGAIQSPVLVGRDDFVLLAERRLAQAAGRGQLLFVAGEAGIGKTRLLSAVSRHAETMHFTLVRAAAYPGDMRVFAGLLIDLVGNLSAHPDPALRMLGGQLSDRIRESSGAGGDAHYRRRVLVQELVDALATVPAVPLLLILEDLHWADQLSLDVLARLAARLAALPVLIAAAYRSNELFADVPLRDIRSRLLAQRLAEEVRLPRLTITETAALIGAVVGGSVPAHLVAMRSAIASLSCRQ